MSKNDSEDLNYFNKSSLTSKFTDYSNVFWLPTICAFGVLTSLLNIFVVGRPLRHHTTHHQAEDHALLYILYNSLIDLFFLLTQFFLIIIRCGTLCPFGYTYGAKFYEIYVYWFVGYCLNTFQSMLNIYESVDRLHAFDTTSISSRRSTSPYADCKLYSMYAGFASFALLINGVTYAWAKRIYVLGVSASSDWDEPDEVLFVTGTVGVFQTTAMRGLRTSLLILRQPVMSLIACLVNVAVAVKFKAYVKKKEIILKECLKKREG